MVTASTSHRRSPKPNFWTDRGDRFADPVVRRDDDFRSAMRDRCTLARVDDDVSDGESVPLRDAQMPSFAFRRSLTACGLALPPDDLIIRPTTSRDPPCLRSNRQTLDARRSSTHEILPAELLWSVLEVPRHPVLPVFLE